MNNMFSKSAIWVVVALLLFMLFKQFDTHSVAGGSKTIAYSELLDDVKARRIKDVVIEGSNITATRTDDSKVRATILDRGLIGDLRENNVRFDVKPPEEPSFLQQVFISWFPMLLLIGVWVFFMRQMQGGGKGGAFSFGKSKARMLDETNNTVTFSDVAGCDEAKEEVGEIVDFLKDPTKFQKLGGRIPRGVLMVGPPGTGKTLLARAIAGEAKVPFFSISGSDFVEMFVGVGASRVRDMFENAKKHSPCIIFIDEIDAVGRHRGAGMGGGNDEREQTLNQLLVEMDGFEASSGVIVIAATNRADVLDKALLRPGRFDRQVMVGLPDIRGREQILNVHMRKVPIGTDVKADIRKSMVMREEERRNTAYHESGHAVVAKLLPKADPVHKVTIMPRGYALGLTWQLPEHDNLSGYKDKIAGRNLDPVRRPHRRRDLRRPDVNRRLERLRPCDQAGALDGDALRHVRLDGRDGLRRLRERRLLRRQHQDHLGGDPAKGGRRDPRHPRHAVRPGAPPARREPREGRDDDQGPARLGNHRRRADQRHHGRPRAAPAEGRPADQAHAAGRQRPGRRGAERHRTGLMR